MKRLSLSAIIILLSSIHAFAAMDGKLIKMEGSFLEPLQKRDSALIADQFKYGFHLKDVAEGTQFMLPDISHGLQDSIDVVSPGWIIDTVKVRGKKKEPKHFDIDASIVITSFDEGKRELRPLALLRMDSLGGADTLAFDPQTIEFFSMPVDTTTYQIHDIKGQVKYPLQPYELLPYVLGIWLVAIICILIWAFLSRKKKAEEGSAYKDPPYLVALRKLDHYRGNKYWAPEKQKTFYSGITDALREYIESRYGIDAMEMTTAEIFKDLKTSGIPADLYEEMKTLFETADFVKFAKHSASDEENAAALPVAVRFVTSTYQEQLDEEEGTSKGDAKNEKGGAV